MFVNLSIAVYNLLINMLISLPVKEILLLIYILFIPGEKGDNTICVLNYRLLHWKRRNGCVYKKDRETEIERETETETERERDRETEDCFDRHHIGTDILMTLLLLRELDTTPVLSQRTTCWLLFKWMTAWLAGIEKLPYYIYFWTPTHVIHLHSCLIILRHWCKKLFTKSTIIVVKVQYVITGNGVWFPKFAI